MAVGLLRATMHLTLLALAATALGGGCAAVLGLDGGNPAAGDGGGGAGVDGGADIGALRQDAANITDASGLGACPSSTRRCGALCVAQGDPGYGCGASACAPCVLGHATARCGPNGCAVDQCAAGWGDCDNDPTNGCEADLTGGATCGRCSVACKDEAPFCSNGGCVSACSAGQTLCGTSCVDTQTSPNHCGPTCAACIVLNATATCTIGVCGYDTCNATYGDCDGNRTNGCETSLLSDRTCGTCTNDCTTQTALHTVKACGSGGTCTPTQCVTGWYDCDANLGNGCECAGAGCCGGGGDSAAPDGAPTCKVPPAPCLGAGECCGNCVQSTSPSPSFLPPPPPPTGQCCSLPGQPCRTVNDCCAGGTPVCTSGTCR